MPARRACIGISDVYSYVRRHHLLTTGLDLVGIEAEWLTFPRTLEPERLPVETLRAAASSSALPASSRVTFEPGGQVELSTLPAAGVDAACDALETDAAALAASLGSEGTAMFALGHDPIRAPARVARGPRYDAMEAYFDSSGEYGRVMMNNTAAVQVNVDMGCDRPEAEARWKAAHALGPLLAGSFANSSLSGSMPNGWRSARLVNWFALDNARTRPVAGHDLCTSWSCYALTAPVMLIRESSKRFLPLDHCMTLAEWIEGGHPLGYPTMDDVAYHFTTLFPPVRPRGWLEVRMIDAVPIPYARAAVCVTHALITDPEARAEALAALERTCISFRDACAFGLQHPDLGRAAEICFAAARRSLERRAVSDSTLAAVTAYEERFVARRRTPADELLEAWIKGRSLFPQRERWEELWI